MDQRKLMDNANTITDMAKVKQYYYYSFIYSFILSFIHSFVLIHNDL